MIVVGDVATFMNIPVAPAEFAVPGVYPAGPYSMEKLPEPIQLIVADVLVVELSCTKLGPGQTGIVSILKSSK